MPIQFPKDRHHQTKIYKSKNTSIELPIDFDWKVYLELNPDIRKQGFTTEKLATEHYHKWGKNEKRAYSKGTVSVSSQQPVQSKIDNINLNKIGGKTVYSVTQVSQPKTKKKLTIVIPNKNGQLPMQTINSLYTQTFKDFDIIIINDFEGNANKARNDGLRLVKTPYVLFSDNDIEWIPTALMDMYNCLEENPNVSIAYGSYQIGSKMISNVEWNPNKLKLNNYISTMSMVRTADHPGFDETIKRLQDWDVWLTMLENGKIGKFIGKKIFSTPIRTGITNGGSIPFNTARSAVKSKHLLEKRIGVTNFNNQHKKLSIVNYDAIVIIPSFNRLAQVQNILTQLFEQTTKYKFKVIVLNDGSNEDYDDLLNLFPKITLLKNGFNYGKENYWKTITKLFKESSKYISSCVIQIDDDSILGDSFIDILIDKFFELKTKSNKYVAIYYKSEDYKVNKTKWGLEKNWLNGGSLFDSEFLKFIDNKIDKTQQNRLDSGVWRQVSIKINLNDLQVHVLNNPLALSNPNVDADFLVEQNKDKLKLLYIGRKHFAIVTGIGASAKMIVDSLNKSGAEVTFVDSVKHKDYLNKKYDVNLIWFYDDSQFKLNNIKQLQKMYRNDVPILINSTFNNTQSKINEINSHISELNSGEYNNVYFGVFSREVEGMVDFSDNKSHIYTIPKTIKNEFHPIPTFGERKNICLGEYNKFMNTDLVGDLNIYDFIRELKDEFKNIDFYAFRHHRYKPNHPLYPKNANKVNSEEEIDYIEDTLKIIDYRTDLVNWIKNFRIYISLNNKETFSMVPAEAQSVGTYVMHRNMPQSLNEYFYHTAYLWESVDDLKNAIRFVYYNREVWTELSELSILNHETNNINRLRFPLRLGLERLIKRHNKIKK